MGRRKIAAKSQRFLFIYIPIIAAALFLSTAAFFFRFRYSNAYIPFMPFPGDENRANLYFNLNFFISLVFCFVGFCGLVLLRSQAVSRWMFFIVAFFSSITGTFLLNDYVVVHLFIYGAFILVMIFAFSFPWNFIIAAISISFFVAFLHSLSYLGITTTGVYLPSIQPEHAISLVLFLFLLAGIAASFRFLLEKKIENEQTIEHLDHVGNRMLLFNQQLQEFVKNTGKEAIRRDRLRFTSELHDSCGYVFTNIVAVCEAAISQPQPDIGEFRKTFRLIQRQARDGLKKTRETLYMIRDMSKNEPGAVDAIFEMKSILEEITDIKIDIEMGNILHDYGPDINYTLAKIVQEAFTNSIRHGKSTRIILSFWDLDDKLEMLVKDNGIGAKNIVKGIGLEGMEDHLKQYGGTLDAYSPPDGGFCIKVAIPLKT